MEAIAVVAVIALLIIGIYVIWYIAFIPKRIIEVQGTEANYTQEELKSFHNFGIGYIVMCFCGAIPAVGWIVALIANIMLAYNISSALGRKGERVIALFCAPFLGMYWAHKKAETGGHGLFAVLAGVQFLLLLLAFLVGALSVAAMGL